MGLLALIVGVITIGDCQPPKTCSCDCPQVYVGGAVQYVDTHFPQHQLAYDPSGISKNQTDQTFVGWTAYAGVETFYNSYWLMGIEAGYKNLARFKTTHGDAKRESYSQAVDGQVSLRYLHCTGVNLFIKGGAAVVFTKITEEGLPLFFERRSYSFTNLYPELTLGFGYFITHNINLVASWSHLFGPSSTSRYSQDFNGGLVSLRPAQAPGFDTISLGIEVKFP